jgi:hypothetical protein
MIIATLLALFCLVIAAASLGLSPTAGRLPALVAVLTLAPVLVQLYSEWRSPRSSSDASALDCRGCLLLLGSLYLAGFLISLPLFAAWSWRKQPVVAAGATAAVFAALLLLGLQLELYPGVLWPR